MKQKNYKGILYFISTVIIVTLGIQVYWNFKNYQTSKTQLINEIQISLDNAVNQYYEDLAKNQTIGFASKSNNLNHFLNSTSFDSILKNVDYTKKRFEDLDLIDATNLKGVSIFRGKDIDTIDQYLNTIKLSDTNNVHITEDPIKALTSKIIISIHQDDINVKEVDSLLLQRKQLSLDYGIRFKDPFFSCDTINTLKEVHPRIIKNSTLKTTSKSSYLPQGSTLELFFTNTTLPILKKNLLGILLSFFLIGAVIGCLLYLLKIINHQKQLAELKNDLISNITHEFKTPIATISAAIEGIQSFNATNDPEKTKKYASMSSAQLDKLNMMVEKILETATLDSDKLQLNLEEANLVELIDNIIEKHRTNTPEKEITFDYSHKNIWKKIDVFHLENAINNVIDNAIKYGGEIITVHIKNEGSIIAIEVIDTGTSLTKTHKDKIFEKFYRVPKGNTHDIKGFGIGLFYTKTIIEKHNGTIQLLLDQTQTNFKITLANG
ncbi:hypothetical protein AB832_01465 [Flavobacteriaceae bacterium (ex Bugula neritina AB1)]|nr:hypothetical protein AB832_01465 [Flavobacteriaceae bacterium (ex Bugula neritina AB1)]